MNGCGVGLQSFFVILGVLMVQYIIFMCIFFSFLVDGSDNKQLEMLIQSNYSGQRVDSPFVGRGQSLEDLYATIARMRAEKVNWMEGVAPEGGYLEQKYPNRASCNIEIEPQDYVVRPVAQRLIEKSASIKISVARLMVMMNEWRCKIEEISDATSLVLDESFQCTLFKKAIFSSDIFARVQYTDRKEGFLRYNSDLGRYIFTLENIVDLQD